MTHYSIASCLLACTMIAGGCSPPVVLSQQPPPEQYVSDPESVGFDIEAIPSGDSTSRWLASYTAHGRTAKFVIELGPTRPAEDQESRDLDIAFGEGRFVSQPGSDASGLLSDLQKALQAKRVPMKVRRVSTLPFTFASLGKNQSQGSDGGFNSNPPGHWTPMKIFLGEGKKEGQVFLNLNPVIKKGQFSIKDPDYGDLVLVQLAKVL